MVRKPFPTSVSSHIKPNTFTTIEPPATLQTHVLAYRHHGSYRDDATRNTEAVRRTDAVVVGCRVLRHPLPRCQRSPCFAPPTRRRRFVTCKRFHRTRRPSAHPQMGTC